MTERLPDHSRSPRKRTRAPGHIADGIEKAKLRPLAKRIADWQVRAARLAALSAACHDRQRAAAACAEARSLRLVVQSELDDLTDAPAVAGSSGSRTADVLKSLTMLAARLEAAGAARSP